MSELTAPPKVRIVPTAERYAESFNRAVTKPCDPKRRALAGAAIGFVTGMVAINRIAADYDTSVGVKGTLGAGGYEAAMGAYVGLMTCQ